MKWFLAVLLLNISQLHATVLYNQTFGGFALADPITNSAGANYRTNQTAGQPGGIIVNHFSNPQSVSLNATGWGGALYNNMTMTGAVSFTARCDASAGRVGIFLHVSSIVAGLPQDGYLFQFIAPNSLYMMKGVAESQVVSATAAPSSTSDFVFGIYRDTSGVWSLFLDNVLKATTGAETTYTAGQVGFTSFNGTMNITNMYLDDLTPTPTNTPVPTATPIPVQSGPAKSQDKTQSMYRPSPTPVRLGAL